MSRAYIKSLERHEHRAESKSARYQPLEARFTAWFDNLPPEAKNRPFSMSEIENALNSQGRHISSVLVQLGWRRKRVWTTQRYCRYWQPPTT